jgi:hypothetical protein
MDYTRDKAVSEFRGLNVFILLTFIFCVQLTTPCICKILYCTLYWQSVT